MKIMFYMYIRCYPNETIMVNCDADAMNVGYSYVQRNFIYKQLDKYRPIATNFSTSQLLYCLIAFCQL